MIHKQLWCLFENNVFSLPSNEQLFNQYKDPDWAFDLPNASEIRQQNLRNYLNCLKTKPEYLLVGEAPGPWGCRFSGVPFTSEAQLCSGEFLFDGRQSSRRDTPYSASGAKIFWKVLRKYCETFLVVNCVPFHPHYTGKPLSIRSPTTKELRTYSHILLDIWKLTTPRVTVAIGRKAEKALALIEVPSKYVRHPSRGGVKAFTLGIRKIFANRH
jgi:hypothetical protein